MKEIFSKFSKGYRFSGNESANVGGHSVCMVIESENPADNFKVTLCEDIMGTSDILIKRLRFSLCSDDIDTIGETFMKNLDEITGNALSLAQDLKIVALMRFSVRTLHSVFLS